MNAQETADLFQNFASAGGKYIERRNKPLLLDFQKEPRNYTQKEVSDYLKLNIRTVDKYCALADIDPRRHEGIQWVIDIFELYKIRNLLPPELRVEPKFERSESQKLITSVIQNQKGGVGKTMSAITLASGLATEYHEEYRVGIIDMDGQSTATMYYAPELEEQGFLTVGDLIRENYELEDGETARDVISDSFLPTTIPNLRILPAGQADRSLDNWYHNEKAKGRIENEYRKLADIINEVQDEFDVIIIDTPPSLNYPVYISYFAASNVIFPLALAENDVDATCEYFKYLPQIYSLVKNAGHDGYEFTKLLFTNHKESTSAARIKSDLTRLFGNNIYPKEFKHSEAIKVCSSLMSSVFDMSKSAYPNTKSTFNSAQTNAFEVISQIHNDYIQTWDK